MIFTVVFYGNLEKFSYVRGSTSGSLHNTWKVNIEKGTYVVAVGGGGNDNVCNYLVSVGDGVVSYQVNNTASRGDSEYDCGTFKSCIVTANSNTTITISNSYGTQGGGPHCYGYAVYKVK